MQILLYAFSGKDADPELYLSPEIPGNPNSIVSIQNDFDYLEEKIYPAIEQVLLAYLKAHNTQYPKDYSLSSLLDILDKDEEDGACFTWYAKYESLCLEPIHISDLTPEYMPIEDIISEFDEWARRMRESIKTVHAQGYMPVGHNIEFSHSLVYTTSYLGGNCPNQAERYLTSLSPHTGTFEGEIENRY